MSKIESRLTSLGSTPGNYSRASINFVDTAETLRIMFEDWGIEFNGSDLVEATRLVMEEKARLDRDDRNGQW